MCVHERGGYNGIGGGYGYTVESGGAAPAPTRAVWPAPSCGRSTSCGDQAILPPLALSPTPPARPSAHSPPLSTLTPLRTAPGSTAPRVARARTRGEEDESAARRRRLPSTRHLRRAAHARPRACSRTPRSRAWGWAAAACVGVTANAGGSSSMTRASYWSAGGKRRACGTARTWAARAARGASSGRPLAQAAAGRRGRVRGSRGGTSARAGQTCTGGADAGKLLEEACGAEEHGACGSGGGARDEKLRQRGGGGVLCELREECTRSCTLN